MRLCCSTSTTWLALRLSMLPYSGRYSGCWDQSTTAKPIATLAANPTSNANWRSMGSWARLSRKPRPGSGRRGVSGRAGSGRVAGVFGVVAASIRCFLVQAQRNRVAGSDRHLHDVFVGGDQLVAHLGHRLERHAGFLRCYHHLRQIDARHPPLVAALQLGGGLLQFIDAVDCLLQQIIECRPPGFLGRCGRYRLRTAHRFQLHGAHLQHQTIEFNTLCHSHSPGRKYFDGKIDSAEYSARLMPARRENAAPAQPANSMASTSTPASRIWASL